MDPIFILFLAFFVAPTLIKILKKSSPTAKPSPKSRSKPNTLMSRLDTQQQGASAPWDKAEFRDLKKTLQDMGNARPQQTSSRSNARQQAQRKSDYEARQRRIKTNAAKRSKRLKAHDASHGNTVEVRDLHDKNRNRRADWGARAGPGVLNSKTLLTALVMGLILVYLLGRT